LNALLEMRRKVAETAAKWAVGIGLSLVALVAALAYWGQQVLAHLQAIAGGGGHS
jgi:hypothetical protein